jgi:hypothetical protein
MSHESSVTSSIGRMNSSQTKRRNPSAIMQTSLSQVISGIAMVRRLVSKTQRKKNRQMGGKSASARARVEGSSDATLSAEGPRWRLQNLI